MRTSRKENSAGGVTSGAERACGQTPAMEEGTGVKPGSSPGYGILSSPSLRSLVGEECLQMLRCSICTEFFSIPIVLPCGHTFCLQCLTDMCKQATRPCGHNSIVTDALIGCPNCRVQIFATPILQRNVTCNFIIQSLVDVLRKRRAPKKTDVSVNTERSLIGPPVRAISEEAVCVLQDLDRLSSSLDHKSVVDDAFFEIDRIRSSYLAHLDKGSGDETRIDSFSSGNSLTQGCDYIPSSFSQPDPTTIKNSLTRHLQNNSSNVNVTPPRKCYAAALASGREKPASSVTASNSVDLNMRGAKSYCSARQISTSPCSAQSLVIPSTQFGRVSVPSTQNKNRNNSKQRIRQGEESQSDVWTQLVLETFPTQTCFYKQDWVLMKRERNQKVEAPMFHSLTTAVMYGTGSEFARTQFSRSTAVQRHGAQNSSLQKVKRQGEFSWPLQIEFLDPCLDAKHDSGHCKKSVCLCQLNTLIKYCLADSWDCGGHYRGNLFFHTTDRSTQNFNDKTPVKRGKRASELTTVSLLPSQNMEANESR